MADNVLIHALGATMGGALRHLTNFLPNLVQLEANKKFTVLVRESIEIDVKADNLVIIRVPDKKASGWIGRLFYDTVLLPIELLKSKYDLIVSLTNFGPIWCPIPHVYFQRNPVYYCPYYYDGLKGKKALEVGLRRAISVASIKYASEVITPSQSMADLIFVRCPSVKPDKFSVIYHGFEKGSLSEPLTGKLNSLIENETRPVLLYPTHAARHKGFKVVFDALGILKKRGVEFCFLSTVGHSDWPEGFPDMEKQIKELDLSDSVVLTGRVPQKQMGALYEKCDLMVYPSLCESFGFSMIEAMGHGLPIVASGTAINKEMCSSGALYYNPLDPEDAAEKITAALDKTVQAQLSENGKGRASEIDWGWQRYAKEFIDMVEKY